MKFLRDFAATRISDYPVQMQHGGSIHNLMIGRNLYLPVGRYHIQHLLGECLTREFAILFEGFELGIER